MPDIVKALHSGRVLLMDGAMGTELFRAGVPRDACLEELNLTQPEIVKGIHHAYVEAGAEVLLTNTFQANPEHLTLNHLQGKLLPIYESAVYLARQVAADRCVLADIGPLTADAFNDAATIFQGCAHADALLMETWSDPRPFGRIDELNYPKLGYCLALLVSFAFRRNADGDIRTYADVTAKRCAEIVTRCDGTALGVNCGTDIRLPELLEIITQYRSVTDLPLFVRPNAGTPKQVDGRWAYPETPESMAAWLPALFEAGVVMVGGCCGTTPAHIAAFRKVVDEWNTSHARSPCRPDRPSPQPLSPNGRGEQC